MTERRRLQAILKELRARLPFTGTNGIVITDLRREGDYLVAVFANGEMLETPLAALLVCDALAPLTE